MYIVQVLNLQENICKILICRPFNWGANENVVLDLTCRDNEEIELFNPMLHIYTIPQILIPATMSHRWTTQSADVNCGKFFSHHHLVET